MLIFFFFVLCLDSTREDKEIKFKINEGFLVAVPQHDIIK